MDVHLLTLSRTHDFKLVVTSRDGAIREYNSQNRLSERSTTAATLHSQRGGAQPLRAYFFFSAVTLNLKKMMSPSLTMYSLPSVLYLPFFFPASTSISAAVDHRRRPVAAAAAVSTATAN